MPPGTPQHSATLLVLLLQCQVCGNCVVGKFRCGRSGSVFSTWLAGQSSIEDAHVKLEEVHPKPIIVGAPQHTPDNVSNFYLQGMHNLPRHYDAAGTMFRKALDTALKHLDPKTKGTLEVRINSLPPTLGVTPAMKEWAHEIRHLGQ